MLKSKLFRLVLGLVSFGIMLSVSVAAYAQIPADRGLGSTAAALNYNTGNGSGDVWSIVTIVVDTLLGVLAFFFFGFTLYAGFRWMTAAGNGEKVEQAQGTLQSSIIGLAIVLAAYALTSFVLKQLGG